MPSVFPWLRTSPHKGKEQTQRNFNGLAALSSAACNLNASVVSAEEPANELPVKRPVAQQLKMAKPKQNSPTTGFTSQKLLTTIIKRFKKRNRKLRN